MYRPSAPICAFLMLLGILIPARAQSTPYALPEHKGAMLLDLQGFHITQLSAKPGDIEIGVRAHNDAHTELLAFLFLTPGHKSQNARSCLDQDIAQVHKDNGAAKEQRNPFNNDTSDAATILITYPTGAQFLYKYAGAADECLVMELYADKGAKLDLTEASAVLARQSYDPAYTPTIDDRTRYVTVRDTVRKTNGTTLTTPRMLVTWYTPGGIPLPTDPAWKMESLTAYDKAARPVALFKNEATGINASFILFENLSGKPTAEGCRSDVMEPLEKREAASISNFKQGSVTDAQGAIFATASHWLKITNTVHNVDVFAFAGNAKVCAEAHVSTVSGKSDEDKRLADALALFHPDLTYSPVPADYLAEAKVFFNESPMLGAPFYDAARKKIPNTATDSESVTNRRIATDRIVIALGLNGDLKAARGFAERAIALDPDYPINYYNLACADAEKGDASAARTHLEQAFARKANVIPGEKMPDPTADSSILKLKHNQGFWAFVQTLNATP